MNQSKKVFSLLFALVMALAMNVTVFASGDGGEGTGDLNPPATSTTYTITITNSKEGHTYKAYQVFTGDLSEGVLSNVDWGTGVNGENLLSALKRDTTIGTLFTNCTTAADVAKVLVDFQNNSANLDKFAEIVSGNLGTEAGTANAPTGGQYTISGLSAGYYFVKDANKVTGTDASTKFILKLVEDTTVTPKSDVPTVEKKVQENSKYESNGGYGAGYNDVADWNIGDHVPFKLIGALPANYSDYDTYKYVFHDTLSTGLTLDQDSIKVYYATSKDAEGNNRTEIALENDQVVIPGTEESNTCSFEIKFDNLKSVAGVSAPGFIIVEYTATLNQNAEIGLDGNPNEVYLEFSNNPNADGEGDTGTTPSDKVVVFTYELDVTKVDGANKTTVLPGAEFKLRNNSNKWVIVENDKVKGWTSNESEGSVLTSDSNGLFKVIGLDDGTYYLKETKAPNQYNELKDEIELEIKATTVHKQDWSGESASDVLKELKLIVTIGETESTSSGNTTTGIVSTQVENNKGATLPETGGIGTRIFYAVGAVLMIGAAVLLITRKRTEKNQ